MQADALIVLQQSAAAEPARLGGNLYAEEIAAVSQYHLSVLQNSLSVLTDRCSFALLLFCLDPADIFAPPEAPLLQAMPASIQALRTTTPAGKALKL